jgi:hypothetical protein
MKRVRVLDDVLDRYDTDERWIHLDPFERMSAKAFLAQIAGNTYWVFKSWMYMGTIMYGLLVLPPITVPDRFGVTSTQNTCQICVDYCEIVESGCMEAS